MMFLWADLISQNNLAPPYILQVGQKITLPKNQYHVVNKGDTLYSISRLYDMNVNNLVAANDLNAPYTIKVGQKLRISNVAKVKIQSLC